jgi:hypothetical protein
MRTEGFVAEITSGVESSIWRGRTVWSLKGFVEASFLPVDQEKVMIEIPRQPQALVVDRSPDEGLWIDAETAVLAMVLWNRNAHLRERAAAAYMPEHTRKPATHREVAVEVDGERILAVLRRAHPLGMTGREVARRTYYPARETRAFLDSSDQVVRAEKPTGPKGGRPTLRYWAASEVGL